MTALLVAMIAGAGASLLLGLLGGRRVARGWLVAEAAMLAAMLDVHLPALQLLPAPLWSALLAGCALVTSLLERLRRRAGAGALGSHAADPLHAIGMLLASVLVLLAGTSALPAASGAHAHGGGLALPLGLAVTAYAIGVLCTAVVVRSGPVDTARRLASLAGLVAMGAMAAAG